jgi:YbbR domain-containing protein
VSWLRTTGLRLALALGLAFALWVFVSYTQNPDRDTSYDSVPVDIVGRAPELVLVDQDGLPRASLPTVNVMVEGDTETLTKLQLSSIRALVDLSALGPGEHQVPVDVATTRSDLKRLTFSPSPSFLPVRLEQEITRTVPLTVELEGTVPFSFEAGTARLAVRNQEIRQVQVRGPQSRVERVTLARVTANIDRLTANYSSPRPVQPIASDGQAVTGVTIEPVNVDVLVPIVSSAGIKRVPVVPQIVGQPASGFIVTNIAVTPQFVRLTGSSGPLDAVQSLATENVDITGAAQTVQRTAAIRTPPNIGLASGEPSVVTVTITVAPLDRPFQITLPVPIVAVDVPDGLSVSLNPSTVQLAVTGSSGRLAGISANALQGVVSVQGRGAGSVTLTPQFNLPEGITIAGEPPRVTVTLRVIERPTEAPTPAPTAEATPAAEATPRPAETAEPPTPEPPTPEAQANPTAVP